MATKKKLHAKGVGLGLAAGAALAAAAGAYFLYGSKNAAENRKKVKSWALKAKAEVLAGIKKARSLDEKSYHALVDAVMKKYQKMSSVGAAEAAALGRELKGHWKHLRKGVAPVKKVVKRVVTKKKK